MLLTITYEGENTQDLGYLLHKKSLSCAEIHTEFRRCLCVLPESVRHMHHRSPAA